MPESVESQSKTVPMAAPLVSVVMPCLNEAESVGVCVSKAIGALTRAGVDGEVVVVDNGSTDGSGEIARQAGARIVLETNRGYGSAYLRGFEEARGTYLVMGDADDSYDFSKLMDFVIPLRDQGYELVMGTRLKGKILPEAMPWTHRWIGNPILSGMLKILFRTSISDSHCGMRSFTRDAYRKMNLCTTGMEFASEIVVAALRSKLRMVEVPITYHPRVGESKLNGLRDAWRHVRFMLLFSPSYIFLIPGLVLVLVGAFLVVSLAGGSREILGYTWDYHPLLFGASALVLGYNVILFDIIAKAFAIGAELAPPERWLQRLSKVFTLERGILFGGLLLFAGIGLEIKIVLDWVRSGYGALMAVKAVVIGMTGIVLGCQTVFASFLLSLILIERR